MWINRLESNLIQIGFCKKYAIRPSFEFNELFISLYGKDRLVNEKGSYIGGLSALQIDEGCKVLIGKGCSISHNGRNYTSSKLPDNDLFAKENMPAKKGDVIIGNFAWGANVFISFGITIGINSVVGDNFRARFRKIVFTEAQWRS